MKRLLSILLLGFLTLSVRAQDISTSEQTLEFYYIAHDRTSPVGKICDFIKERQKEATYYKDLAMIFYLANGDDPMIVRMNMPGDNREDFQDIINALQQQMSHDINPRDDVRHSHIVQDTKCHQCTTLPTWVKLCSVYPSAIKDSSAFCI